jgi:c-di-GMP-binding flagellar brake protein YcgR
MHAVRDLAVGQEAVVTVESFEVPLQVVVEAVHGDRVTLRATFDGDTPNASSDLLALHDGETVVVQYVDRFGVYEMDASVLQHDHGALVVGLAAGGEAARRRVYVRLRAPLDATCLLLDPDRNAFTELDASVVDVGGGGAALAVPAIAPTGATMVCSIALAPGAPVVAVAHVLPPDADPRDQPERRHGRVQFSLIAEGDRDRLLRFILDALARSRAS